MPYPKGDELASPGEYNTINTTNGKEKITFENFGIPSDQTPIIQIENDANNQKSQRIPKSLSTPAMPSSVKVMFR